MIDILLIKTWIKSLAQSSTCQNGKLDHWIVMKRIKFTWKFLTHHHRHHQKGKTTRREKNKIHFVDKNLLNRCVGASCKAASIDWVSIRFRMCLNIDLTLCHDFPPAKATTTNNKNKLRRVESNFFPSFFLILKFWFYLARYEIKFIFLVMIYASHRMSIVILNRLHSLLICFFSAISRRCKDENENLFLASFHPSSAVAAWDYTTTISMSRW